MSEQIHIFALGGLDEEGKNLLVVRIGEEIYVINAGAKTPDKTMPGIDYVIPQYDYLVENKDKIRAYVLLHGHDDELGALPFIYPNAPAPVYGSPTTLSMLKTFCTHVKKDPAIFDLHPVPATSTFKIQGRPFHFFHTAHNVADSSGVAIETSLGNIVITGDFVIENSADPAYLNDMNAIARIAEHPTLALLSESVYAERPGYTAPLYKLTPHIEQVFKLAEGRIFVSLYSNDLYNIDEVARLVVEHKRKLICYDEATLNMVREFQLSGQLNIPKANVANMDDILRVRDQDVVVLMTGFGSKLFRKIALLATAQNEDRRFTLKESDHFIVANMPDDNTEIEYTDAADSLYRSGCKVTIVPKKRFLAMHASEEDLKMMASILKPKYYIPVKGFYKDLLANAMLALSMGINLNHTNVFVLENGLSVIIDEKGGRLMNEGIVHGDMMIDGAGEGDVSAEVIADREKLGEGVVVIGATLSRSLGKCIAGPDVQMRGFLYGKDSEMAIRDLNKTFEATLNEVLLDRNYDINEVRQFVYERCLRSIRHTTGGREPMVLPLIVEVD